MRLFIVNQQSGRGRGQKAWRQIEPVLKQRGIPYQVQFTEYPAHGIELAKQASSDLRAVIAVGGDGTLHEVSNGLKGKSIPLGYIPAGSGNDFARAERIPFEPLPALERILRHQPRPIDLAEVNGRTMIGFSGIGFDAQVAYVANRSKLKRLLKRSIYLYCMLKMLWSYQPTETTITIDGETHHFAGIWLIAVNNIPTYGGGMKVCPDAKNDDSWLDICCVRYCHPLTFLRLFPNVYKGSHVHHSLVSVLRGKEISIQTAQPLTIHIDGEIAGTTPLTIQLKPRNLFLL
jgi:diacylglycerol kinase (ATP)